MDKFLANPILSNCSNFANLCFERVLKTTNGRRALGTGPGIYVEIRIHAPLGEVWRLTQDPALHQRWDLRFTRISHLPGSGPETRFRYATRVLPGLTIAGTGVAAGERIRPDGTRTSALRFGSTDRLSLIRDGSGYWRYIPAADGIRFLTGYDYTPAWGRAGRLADALFRPVMAWATAWSFDRLRLWLERGIAPGQALRNAVLDMMWRVVSAVIAVIAAGSARAVTAVAVVLAVVLLPPSPRTPAARRCLRRAPDGRTAPSTLASLELI